MSIKKKVKHNLPIHWGLFTYCQAKLVMLKFYFNFLIKYFDVSFFNLIYSDTDSFFISFAETELFDNVKPHLKDDFAANIQHWLPIPFCDTHRPTLYTAGWLPNPKRNNQLDMLHASLPCCVSFYKDDCLTPFKFKPEFICDEMICLAPKTYICKSRFGEQKLSSKGLSQKQNTLTLDQYKQVLVNQKAITGQNRGFRLDQQKQMCTYIQEKVGLSYLYLKRHVSENGIDTTPTHL